MRRDRSNERRGARTHALVAGAWLVAVATSGCVINTLDDGGGDETGADPTGGSVDDSGGQAIDVPDTDYCSGVGGWPGGQVAFELEVLQQVNLARAQGGTCGAASFGAAPPLTMESRLLCAARVHSLDMATRGFFDHTNPDGQSPFDRMTLAGYTYQFAAENIAAGQTTPEEVVATWLQSPGHCANILSSDFTQIGVGHVADPSAQFPHYWTQVFGLPG